MIVIDKQDIMYSLTLTLITLCSKNSPEQNVLVNLIFVTSVFFLFSSSGLRERVSFMCDCVLMEERENSSRLTK